MTNRAFKPILLDLLRQAQINQNAFFQQLPPAELATIGTPAFWSAKDHVAQYLLDRHDLNHALETYESWANRVVEAEVPATLKGYMLYNLACFYATHSRLEQARPTLQQAITLFPATREFALTDPDLAALRPHFSD